MEAVRRIVKIKLKYLNKFLEELPESKLFFPKKDYAVKLESFDVSRDNWKMLGEIAEGARHECGDYNELFRVTILRLRRTVTDDVYYWKLEDALTKEVENLLPKAIEEIKAVFEVNESDFAEYVPIEPDYKSKTPDL